MKNIRTELGGTKEFIISLSHSQDGPWTDVLTDEFSKYEGNGCAPMQQFDLK